MPVDPEDEDAEGDTDDQAPQEADDNDNDNDNDNEDNNDNDTTHDRDADTDRLATTTDMADTATVQILDLHTPNPLISYKEHIFSCQWSNNVGTELLFTRHDPASPLPSLRPLRDNVDLLAATSTRLTSTHVVLNPCDPLPTTDDFSSRRGRPRGRGRSWRGIRGNLTAESPRSDFAIEVGKQASEVRKSQASFLEELMELKAERGEQDAVTVVANKRQTRSTWKAVFEARREEEKKKWEAVLVAGGEGAEAARAWLERRRAVDEEREAIGEVGKEKAKPGPKARHRDIDLGTGGMRDGDMLRRRPRGRGGKKGLLAAIEARMASGTASTASAMTPISWGDIAGEASESVGRYDAAADGEQDEGEEEAFEAGEQAGEDDYEDDAMEMGQGERVEGNEDVDMYD